MKVVHLSTSKEFRGGERQLRWIHEGLLVAEVESVIICDSTNLQLTELEGSRGVNSRFVLAVVQTFLLLRKLNADVVHCHDSNALTMASFLKPFIQSTFVFSRKTVFRMRDDFLSRKKFGILSALVAISEEAAKPVRQLHPALPISIIHDGVEWASQSSRETVLHQNNIPLDTLTFGSVGYFSTEKNLPLLIKCADIFANSYPKAKLILIGPVVPSVFSLVEKHPAIIALGKVTNAAALYSGFDCYLSSSTQEGLGSALLDAVVRDIPAIALDSGGSREMFSNNDKDHCSSEAIFLKRVLEFLEYGVAHEAAVERGKKARDLFSVKLLQQKHIELYSRITTK